MLPAPLLILAFAAMSQSVPRESAPVAAVEISLRRYGPGWTAAVVSASHRDESTGLLWITDDLCRTGFSGGGGAGAGSGTVWRVSGRIARRDGNAWIVRVDWQQQSVAGRAPASVQAYSKDLWLEAGQYESLERFLPQKPGDCGAVEASLEVGVVLQDEGTPMRGGGVSARPRPEADVWLIHRLPDGKEDAMQMQESENHPYSAGPVMIRTDQSSVRVDVRCRISLRSFAQDLYVDIDRVVQIGNSATHGGSRKSLPWPAPDDVIAFELPPVMEGGRDVLAGDQFSVRIRVKR